jgi:DNA polymerase-4
MRSVLFIDPPAFCTTLEVLRDPQLRRRPLAIAQLAADRAVILAVSAEARLAGVTRGMAVALARRVCPDLVVRPPNPGRYAQAHRALHAILAEVAPVIEPRGWGHAYLDLTGTERLFGPATVVARRLERTVRERLSLPLAVGVAINKLVSESAATVVKREAGADIWAVAPGYEAAFLAPERVALLPDVPEQVRQRLDDYHLERIGEVAAIGETALRVAFGANGRQLHAHAQGIDPRPVLPPEVQASLRESHELTTDSNDPHLLASILRPLAEGIGRTLRARRLMASRLTVMIRHADDTTAERSVSVGAAPLDVDLWRAACRALEAALTRRIAVRSLVLTATHLHDGGGQLELWPSEELCAAPKAVALQRAVDRVFSRGRQEEPFSRGRQAAGGRES